PPIHEQDDLVPGARRCPALLQLGGRLDGECVRQTHLDLPTEKIGQQGVRVTEELDRHRVDLGLSMNIVREGRKHLEGARLPLGQSIGTGSNVARGPVLVLWKLVGVARKRLAEEMPWQWVVKEVPGDRRGAAKAEDERLRVWRARSADMHASQR